MNGWDGRKKSRSILKWSWANLRHMLKRMRKTQKISSRDCGRLHEIQNWQQSNTAQKRYRLSHRGMSLLTFYHARLYHYTANLVSKQCFSSYFSYAHSCFFVVYTYAFLLASIIAITFSFSPADSVHWHDFWIGDSITFSVQSKINGRHLWRDLTHWGRGHLNCLNARSRGF